MIERVIGKHEEAHLGRAGGPQRPVSRRLIPQERRVVSLAQNDCSDAVALSILETALKVVREGGRRVIDAWEINVPDRRRERREAKREVGVDGPRQVLVEEAAAEPLR